MPQEFHVVQCYSCQTFQVHQVKKITKWVCKMCGEKQSLKKEFGRGSGADCRLHVQKLNTLRAELDKQPPKSATLYERRDSLSAENETVCTDGQTIHCVDAGNSPQQNKETKWNMFVEENHGKMTVDDDDDGDDNNDRYTTDAQMFNKAGKRKRENKTDLGHKHNTKWRKYTVDSSEDSTFDNNNVDVIRTKEKNILFEDNEYRSMSRSSEAGYQGFSSKPLSDRGHGTYSSLSSFQKREASRTFDGQYSFQEREASVQDYARRRDDNTSFYNKSFYERERTGVNNNNNVESLNANSDLPYFSVSNDNVRNSDQNKILNKQDGSKWGMFADNDISSQNSNTESSQVSNEDLNDTRPYVTFDPEEIESFNKKVPISTGHTKESMTSNHGESNIYQTEVDKELKNGTVNISKQTCLLDREGSDNKSKWSCFVSGKRTSQSVGYSDHTSSYGACNSQHRQEENCEDLQNRQNTKSKSIAEKENLLLNKNISKWETFTKSLDISDVENIKYFSGGSHWNDVKKQNLIYQGDDNVGPCSTRKSNKSESAAPIFTVGELDDSDFEL